MHSDDDFLMLTDDEVDEHGAHADWHILVVDDDPDVHAATEFSLAGARVGDRPLRFTHAHSAAEAIAALEQHTDVDLLLLDMVMEQQDSGLEVARWIREVAQRHGIPTIVLRSGQPGMLTHETVLQNPYIDSFIEKQHATRAVLLKLLSEKLLGQN